MKLRVIVGVAAIGLAAGSQAAGSPGHAKPKACAVTAQPAALIRAPQQTIPSGVHLDGDRSVLLSITITTNGSVGSARVLETSGIAELDAAAVSDAKRATFAPAIANCVAVKKDYVYRVNYSAGATPSPAQAQPDVTPPPAKRGTCAVPDKDVTMIAPVPPDIIAGSDIGDGLVLLDITVDADGDVSGYTVVKSSGSPLLDNAAYAGAKRSKYAPKRRNCVPVEGHYKYRLQIDPNRH